MLQPRIATPSAHGRGDPDPFYCFTAYNMSQDSVQGRATRPSSPDVLSDVPLHNDRSLGNLAPRYLGQLPVITPPRQPSSREEDPAQPDGYSSSQGRMRVPALPANTYPAERDLSTLGQDSPFLRPLPLEPLGPARQLPRKPLPPGANVVYGPSRSFDDESDETQLATVEEVGGETGPARGWRFYGAFGTLCLASFIIALDSTIIGVALPTIAEDIGATGVEAFWCGTSVLLASTVVQPPVTSLSHIFGRRSALLTCLTFFTTGTVLAAVSRGVAPLLAGRTLQGLGSGGMLALTYVVTTDLVSLRERGKWQGLISMSWAVGSIVGPLVGGALVEADWPWIFWVNMPFCTAAYVAIPLTLRLRRKRGSVREKLGEIDWIGCAVFVCSLSIFLTPLSWGGIMYDWSDSQTVAPLSIGILGLIGFGVHMRFSRHYSRSEPLLRTSLFRSMTAVGAYFATIIHGIITWCFAYYVPLYHEVRGSSPLGAGVAILPFTGTIAPAAVVIGILVAKTGKYRRFIRLGWVLVPLGTGLMMLLERDTPTYKWVLIYLTGGLGLGILFSGQAFAAQAAASHADLPFAASLYAFSRSLGQAFGVAVGGVTLQNELKKEFQKSKEFSEYADKWSQDASALVQVLKKLPEDMGAMKDTIAEAYVEGLRTLWTVLCILSAIALVVSLVCTKSQSLARDLNTEQGLIEVSKKPRNYSAVSSIEA